MSEAAKQPEPEHFTEADKEARQQIVDWAESVLESKLLVDDDTVDDDIADGNVRTARWPVHASRTRFQVQHSLVPTPIGALVNKYVMTKFELVSNTQEHISGYSIATNPAIVTTFDNSMGELLTFEEPLQLHAPAMIEFLRSSGATPLADLKPRDVAANDEFLQMVYLLMQEEVDILPFAKDMAELTDPAARQAVADKIRHAITTKTTLHHDEFIQRMLEQHFPGIL